MSSKFAVIVLVLVAAGTFAVVLVIRSMTGGPSGVTGADWQSLRIAVSRLERTTQDQSDRLAALDRKMDGLEAQTLQWFQELASAPRTDTGEVDSAVIEEVKAASLEELASRLQPYLQVGPGNPPGGPGGRERDPEKEFERMRDRASKMGEELGLTEFQIEEVARIYMDETTRREELEQMKRDGTLTVSEEEFREMREAIKADTDAALQSILTAEQIEKYQAKGPGKGPKPPAADPNK